MQNLNQKEVLNLKELCIFLDLSKSTIYKFTMNGTIPFYKQARHLFFDKKEIIEWLKQHRGFNIEEIEADAVNMLNLKKNKSKP